MTAPSRASRASPLDTACAALRVLVTRPAVQAADWAARLCSQGVDAVALPLIAIDGPPDVDAVHGAWARLRSRALVVFVSPNAVAHFMQRRPADLSWPAGVWAATPGPGTGAALREAGVPPESIVEPEAGGERFDSEALWAVLGRLCAWRGRSVLIVRGSVSPPAASEAGDEAARGSGREWLAERLVEAGAEVDFVVAYCRRAPRFDAAQQALWAAARATPARHLWLLSSSEALEQLEALAQGGESGPSAWRASRALATHPRIAERARRAGFGTVIESAPTLAAVAAAIRTAGGPGEAAGSAPPSDETDR